jgi:mono/diheme cytochrome c family protein
MTQSTAGRVLLSIIAATCVTLITNALDWSPTVSLVGAALAAAVPALITAGGPYGIGLGVGVTAAALGVTYFGFTAVDVATDRPLTFPAPERVEEQLGVTTVSTDTTETQTTETETTPTTTSEETGDPEAGKELFAANGCGGCHTFEPAGSSGTTGPDLDELSDLAENANQPLAGFTRTSITDPTAYVEEGFPEGLMPAYDLLSDEDLNNLVAFLTQS